MTLFKGRKGRRSESRYTEYQQLLQENKIAEATIKKSELTNYDFHGDAQGAGDDHPRREANRRFRSSR